MQNPIKIQFDINKYRNYPASFIIINYESENR